MRRKTYVPVYKPDPPPKLRGCSPASAPAGVFLLADGTQTQVQRGVVLVADYLTARPAGGGETVDTLWIRQDTLLFDFGRDA